MPEWVYQLFMAGAIYGGIRADLKNMQNSIKEVREIALRAHERFDAHLGKN